MADVSMDTVRIEIESTMKDSTSSIDTLIIKLDNLKTSISDIVKASSKLTEFKNNVKSASSIPNIKTSGGSSKGRTPAAPKAPFAEYGSLQSQLKSLNVDLDTSKAVSSLKTLNSEITKYKTNTGQIVTVNKKVKDGMIGFKVSVKDASDKFKDMTNNVKNGTDVWSKFKKSLSGSMLQIGVVINGLRSIVSKLADTVEQAATYEEALNLFTVTMGDFAQEGMAWVEKFSNALYLDPTNVMQYMGAFNSLIKGLGVGQDNAYLMSQNLTQLVYDLASFKNLSFEEAFLKIQSAISGEIEPLRNVGVALSQNTLQELANSLGIEKRVAEMSEAEKAQLRYIQILRSTGEWQTDMGRTIITPANALRVLREQFTLLAKAIGRIFIPMLMAILPYVTVVTQALTKLANKIANFFGYEIADVDYSGGFSNVIGGLEDIGNEADETKKKLNTMLAPFDELNVVQNKNKSTGTGGSTPVGGDLGVDLPFYDALKNLDPNFTKNIEKAEKILNGLLPVISGIGAALGTWKISSSVIAALTAIGVSGGTIAIIGGVATALGVLGVALYDAYQSNETFKDSFNTNWSKIRVTLQPIIENATKLFQTLRESFDTVLVPMMEEIYIIIQTLAMTLTTILFPVFNDILLPAMNAILIVLNDIFNSFNTLWNDYGVPISESIQQIIKDIGDLFTSLWQEYIKPVLDNVKEKFTDVYNNYLKPIFDNVGELIGEVMLLIGNLWNKLLKPVANWLIATFGPVFDTVFSIISDVVFTAVKFVSNQINSMLSVLKGIIKFINGVFSGDWEKAWEGIKDIFRGVLNGIAGVVEGMANACITLLNGAIKAIFNGIKSLVNSVLKTVENLAEIIGFDVDLTIKGSAPQIKLVTIDKFETGGYPTKGDLFYANENGIPEMVGRIGNQTAVANNDQIETSLTNALLYALDKSGSGRNNPSRIVVNIGNRKVYEGVGEHIDNENDRYGTDYVTV